MIATPRKEGSSRFTGTRHDKKWPARPDEQNRTVASFRSFETGSRPRISRCFFETLEPSASFGESPQAAHDSRSGSFGSSFFSAIEPFNLTQILALRRFGSIEELATRDSARTVYQSGSFGDGVWCVSGTGRRPRPIGRDVFVVEIATEQIAISRERVTLHSRCVLFTTRCDSRFDRTSMIERRSSHDTIECGRLVGP